MGKNERTKCSTWDGEAPKLHVSKSAVGNGMLDVTQPANSFISHLLHYLTYLTCTRTSIANKSYTILMRYEPWSRVE